MTDFPVLAGLMSTTLFVASYLPMLYRAVTTRDLGPPTAGRVWCWPTSATSFSRSTSYSLPTGPIWFLHGFYLGASALMLGLHLRHIGMDSASGRAADTDDRDVGAVGVLGTHHPSRRRQ